MTTLGQVTNQTHSECDVLDRTSPRLVTSANKSRISLWRAMGCTGSLLCRTHTCHRMVDCHCSITYTRHHNSHTQGITYTRHHIHKALHTTLYYYCSSRHIRLEVFRLFRPRSIWTKCNAGLMSICPAYHYTLMIYGRNLQPDELPFFGVGRNY